MEVWRHHALGNTVRADACVLVALLGPRTQATGASTAIVSALLPVTLGSTGLAVPEIRVPVPWVLVAGPPHGTGPAFAAAAVVPACFGGNAVFLEAVRLTGLANVGLGIDHVLEVANQPFRAFTAARTSLRRYPALLAIAGAYLQDADPALSAGISRRAGAAEPVPGALVPTTLLVDQIARGHETLRLAEGDAHAALAVPVHGAFPAGASASVVAALLARAGGDAVRRADPRDAVGRSGGTLATGPAAEIGSADLTVANREAGCPAVAVQALEPGSTFAAGAPAAIVPALLSGAIGRTVPETFAEVIVADGPRRAEATEAAAAVRATLLAVTVGRTSQLHADPDLAGPPVQAQTAGTVAAVVPALLSVTLGLTGQGNADSIKIALLVLGTLPAGATATVIAAIPAGTVLDALQCTDPAYAVVPGGAEAAEAAAAVPAALRAATVGLTDLAVAPAVLHAKRGTGQVPLLGAAVGIQAANAGLARAALATRCLCRLAPIRAAAAAAVRAGLDAGGIPGNKAAIGIIVADTVLAGTAAAALVLVRGRAAPLTAGIRMRAGRIRRRGSTAVVRTGASLPAARGLASARQLTKDPALTPANFVRCNAAALEAHAEAVVTDHLPRTAGPGDRRCCDEQQQGGHQETNTHPLLLLTTWLQMHQGLF